MDRKFLFQFHQIPELCYILFCFRLIPDFNLLPVHYITPFRSDPLVSPPNLSPPGSNSCNQQRNLVTLPIHWKWRKCIRVLCNPKSKNITSTETYLFFALDSTNTETKFCLHKQNQIVVLWCQRQEIKPVRPAVSWRGWRAHRNTQRRRLRLSQRWFVERWKKETMVFNNYLAESRGISSDTKPKRP